MAGKARVVKVAPKTNLWLQFEEAQDSPKIFRGMRWLANWIVALSESRKSIFVVAIATVLDTHYHLNWTVKYPCVSFTEELKFNIFESTISILGSWNVSSESAMKHYPSCLGSH